MFFPAESLMTFRVTISIQLRAFQFTNQPDAAIYIHCQAISIIIQASTHVFNCINDEYGMTFTFL